jgi:hypothetical protein
VELHQIEQVDSQDMQAALPQYFKVSEKNFICKMRAVAREMLTGDAFRARACVCRSAWQSSLDENQKTKLVWRLMTERRVAMRKPLRIGMLRSCAVG